MAKILGIEFAPLNIPFRRRVQTLCAFQWVLTFLFGGFGCLFLTIYLLFTRYYWITLLYMAWYAYDRNASERGGHRNKFIRGLTMWKYMAEYFPAKLVKTVDLDPNRSYIFGVHPHGIMQTSGFLSFCTEATGFSAAFPGLVPHLLVLSGQFMFPFYRDYLLSSGLSSVSKASFRWILNQKGHIACVVPGGALEALEAYPGHHYVVIKDRKGFIKQAMLYGAPLVPVYDFGEVDIYDQVPNPEGSFLKKFQTFLTKHVFGFAPPIFKGRGVFNYTFGIMPFRKPITTVVGRPIEVEKNENPTKPEVEELHAKYLKELENLFDENKTKFGLDESVKLQFH